MQPPSPSAGELVREPAALAGSSSARQRRTGPAWEPYAYLLPGLIVFTLFVALPVVAAIGLSLTAWNGISWNTATFIGLDNYRTMLTVPGYKGAPRARPANLLTLASQRRWP